MTVAFLLMMTQFFTAIPAILNYFQSRRNARKLDQNTAITTNIASAINGSLDTMVSKKVTTEVGKQTDVAAALVVKTAADVAAKLQGN